VVQRAVKNAKQDYDSYAVVLWGDGVRLPHRTQIMLTGCLIANSLQTIATHPLMLKAKNVGSETGGNF